MQQYFWRFMILNVEAFKQKQHFPTLLVEQDSTTRNEIKICQGKIPT